MKQTPTEILTKARDIVAAPGGWDKGELSPRANCYCAIGALAIAKNIATADELTRRGSSAAVVHDAYDEMESCPAAAFLVQAILAFNSDDAYYNPSERAYTIWRWNDGYWQTQQGVVSGFDYAIELAQAAEAEKIAGAIAP